MPAHFILSFDCEGKWGVADSLTPSHDRDLTDAKLEESYRSILALLDEHQIEATFAFAGAFSQSRKDFARIRPELEQLATRAAAFLRPALSDIDRTSGQGWHGDSLVDAVSRAATLHEVGLHGVTHVPWTEMDRSFAEAEMSLFQTLEGPVRASRTFVYPRNLVAHTDVLADFGFEGFRAAPPQRSRLRSLLSEFNVFEQPERPDARKPIIAIPAGFFVNWQKGARRVVPPPLTRMRARRLLRAAAAQDRVVHYWLHPENIATAPATLGVLRAILQEVAHAREAGDCLIHTQLGYCRWIESLP